MASVECQGALQVTRKKILSLQHCLAEAREQEEERGIVEARLAVTVQVSCLAQVVDFWRASNPVCKTEVKFADSHLSPAGERTIGGKHQKVSSRASRGKLFLSEIRTDRLRTFTFNLIFMMESTCL